MNIYSRNYNHSISNIEILNLLIAIKKLEGDSYLLSEEKIKEYFALENDDDFKILSYFQIVTLLYYIGDTKIYEHLKDNLENGVVNKFQQEKEPFLKSEYTLLFFDFICCPYVSAKAKKKVITISKYDSQSLNDVIKNIEAQKKWFMDWDSEIDLERVIKKKEFASSY